MSDSSSSQSAKPYPDPPRQVDDADAWGCWAIEFLDRLCREWNKWQDTWNHREEPVYSQSDPDAFLALERTPRRVGTSRKLVTGRPPPGISKAVPLLEVCSDAVNRFSAQSEWRFADQEQADEVTEALLQGAQLIQNRRYDELSHAMLEKLSRLVRMATRRPDPTEGSPKGGTPRQPRRGRKPDTDPKEDKRIADLWATGRHKTFAELDRAHKLPTGTAKRAVDRHRKRR